jgi:hypothetical protein
MNSVDTSASSGSGSTDHSQHRTAHADIISEFLARKQAVMQDIVARFPVLPRMLAICAAYCVVACLCATSLIFLFVGSFILTGHDHVMARLRWLVQVVRAARGNGIAGRGLALLDWLIRMAGGLLTAAANVAASAAGEMPGASTNYTQQQQQHDDDRHRSQSTGSRHHTQSSYRRRTDTRSSGYTRPTYHRGTSGSREYRASTL